uniref:Uncharacterized protein n=1 Tax=Pipistrellus kuhlii TaxID=59472 RepID=A0A7J7UMA1_PIPKU|nr:hypothetical protein mPipKuh1_008767 [Pipistrellus kuhlii]
MGLDWSWRPSCAADWCTGMARSSPEGSPERPWPSPPTPAPTCADTGCCQPKSSEFLRLKTTAVCSAPGTEWPDLTTSALSAARLEPGAWVKCSSCLTTGLGTPAATCPCSFPPTEPDGSLPCAKSPGSPWSWWPLRPHAVHPGPLLGACQPACQLHPPISGDGLRKRRATRAV